MKLSTARIATMDNREARCAIEELINAYGQCLDDGRLEEWPDFFTEDCLYQILPRENADQGLQIAVIYCDGRGMLQDRVTAYRTANLFAPHLYRHLMGGVRIGERHNGVICARTNYSVFRTAIDPIHYGATEVYSVGEYNDKIVFAGDVPKFKERVVIADTSRIQSLLVTPI
jgi:anthranilate 1,2-dioxygenase small subunit